MNDDTIYWAGPDMGGTEWLAAGEIDGIEALVCPDPTGDTDGYVWAVNDHRKGKYWDDYTIVEGMAPTHVMAKVIAAAAFRQYRSVTA